MLYKCGGCSVRRPVGSRATQLNALLVRCAAAAGRLCRGGGFYLRCLPWNLKISPMALIFCSQNGERGFAGSWTACSRLQ